MKYRFAHVMKVENNIPKHQLIIHDIDGTRVNTSDWVALNAIAVTELPDGRKVAAVAGLTQASYLPEVFIIKPVKEDYVQTVGGENELDELYGLDDDEVYTVRNHVKTGERFGGKLTGEGSTLIYNTPVDYSPKREKARQQYNRAKKLLRHYYQMCWNKDRSGPWDSDHDTEVNEIVDAIVAGILTELGK